jgi:hypothetical protein
VESDRARPEIRSRKSKCIRSTKAPRSREIIISRSPCPSLLSFTAPNITHIHTMKCNAMDIDNVCMYVRKRHTCVVNGVIMQQKEDFSKAVAAAEGTIAVQKQQQQR